MKISVIQHNMRLQMLGADFRKMLCFENKHFFPLSCYKEKGQMH